MLNYPETFFIPQYPAHHPIAVVALARWVKDVEQAHLGQYSSRPLSESYEIIGKVGEWQYAYERHLLLDMTVRPNGDRGYDFDEYGWTVDIKTAKKPKYLLREVNLNGKLPAMIYVLAGFDMSTHEVTLKGYEFNNILVAANHIVIMDKDCRIPSYSKLAKFLRPMSQLDLDIRRF